MKKSIKNLIKNLIFLSILCLLENKGYCYVLDYNALYQNIYSQVEQQSKKEIVKYSKDYKINITGIPKENIVTNDYNPPRIEIVSQETSFSPISYKRIYIKDSNNNLVKSFPINVQTKIYKDVLVAKEIIPFGQEVNENNTQLQKCDISRNLTTTLNRIPEGSISKRNFSKGNLILANSIKPKAVILKNSIVNINFISKTGVEIKLQGHALKDGALGEMILVKSDKYNKTYSAIVNSVNDVTVRI